MQTGFSLLELLIVLVIIGIFASIAIPAYCTGYEARSQVAAGIVIAQNITLRISAYSQTNKRLPDNSNDAVFKLSDHRYVESLSWHPEQSALLVILSPHVAKVTDEGKAIVFTATGTIDNLQWQCSNKHSLITANPVANKYLPHNCRSDS